MSTSSFDEFLNIIRPYITKQATYWRNPISAVESLTIILRYLATGINFAALQYEFYISKSTIANIIRETCQVLWSCLQEMEMPNPTEQIWLEVADTFCQKTNFPNCVGSVDGKHIRCRKPKKSGSNFFNYKKFCSVILLAVADANLRFIAIDVGAFRKEGDSTVFRDSLLGKKLYAGDLNLPAPRCLPNSRTHPQPFAMVGDEAFKLHRNILRPYPFRNLNPSRKVFNYRLSRCRRSVECAFGVLVEPDFVDDIIKAYCILHNFVRRRDGVNYEDCETHPFIEVNDCGPSVRAKGQEVKEFFADYFMEVGAVPFQRNRMF